MGRLRFTDIQTRPSEVLDLTSLTVDEFQLLVLPFEAAFQAHMARWRLDGRPRTARQYTTDQNCPLPTPEDRLLFILVYLKSCRGGCSGWARAKPISGFMSSWWCCGRHCARWGMRPPGP
jgi:hypothetical protein